MANISTLSVKDSRDAHDLTFYKFAIESLPLAVMTVDPDLRITGFNSSAEEVTGFSKEETIGKHCGEILQGELCKTNCPLRTVLNHHGSIVRTESTFCNKSGETIPIRQHAAGLFDDHGALIRRSGGLRGYFSFQGHGA